MYLYKKEMFNLLKFHFNGIENINQNYSQSFQDLFVLSVLDGKKHGTFLEIGADHPIFINNTYLLEKYFGWTGVSIDIQSYDNLFKMAGRINKFVTGDATKIDYNELLDKIDNNKRIDYLSLDIEPNIQTLNCLKKLPLDKYRFSTITYETDYYDSNTTKEINDYVRNESRKILIYYDYELVNGNVSNLDDNHPFEDWYIDNSYFSQDIINKFKRSDDNPLASHKYMLTFNDNNRII